MRYKKKGSDKIAMMNIEIDDNDEEEFYMCVNLTEKDDSISIMTDSKWYILFLYFNLLKYKIIKKY